MGLTIRLTAKIRDALGPDAAEDLMDWMQTVNNRHEELREIHELTTARFEARLDQAKAELRTEISEFRGEMRTGLAAIRTDMAGMETRFERRFNDLLKWTFVFWSTTLLTLLAALGILR